MKVLKSLTLVAVFSFIAVTGAFAQFSIGADLGLPLGSFGDVSNIGFGASARYDAEINDNLHWTASAGFLSFGGKSISGFSYGSTSIIPLVGGVKYYFQGGGSGFYGGVDAGLYITSFSVNILGQAGSVSDTKFGLAPGVGYRSGQWDFGARFTVISDLNYLGIRAAYVLGGK